MSASTPVYALRGSQAFNGWLHQELAALAEAVVDELRDNVGAVVLGGSFGRGEGGVMLRDGIERPYHDVNLLLIVRDPREADIHGLDRLAATHAQRIGCPICFGHLHTVDDVRAWEPSVLWHELYHHHVVLYGPRECIRANAPEQVAAQPPVVEGLRLLLQAAMLLVEALRVKRRLQAPPGEDFLRRALQRAIAESGDALLLGWQHYVPSVLERRTRLQDLAGEIPQLAGLACLEAYPRALDFQLQPDCLPPDAPGEAELRHGVTCWAQALLAFERHRTGHPFASLHQYAAWDQFREPEENTAIFWPRNFWRNCQHGRLSVRSTREELYPAVARLLAAPDDPRFTSVSASLLELYTQ